MTLLRTSHLSNSKKYSKSLEKIKLKTEEINKLKFAMFFRHIRFTNKLKQIAMAERLKVTQGTISKIESGDMLPDVMVYLKFKEVFSLQTDSWEFVPTEEEIQLELKRKKRR